MRAHGISASHSIEHVESAWLRLPPHRPDAPVVVTGVGGPAGLALSGQLVARGIRVIGTDCREVDVASVDCRVVPVADHPRFLDVLATIAIESSACLIIPTVSEELPVFAAAPEFPIEVLVSPNAAIRIADDKAKTATVLSDAGLGVPATALVSDGQCRVDELGQHVVSKPRVGRGGRGVEVLEAPVDMVAVPRGNVLQAFASGDEYDVNVWIDAEPCNDKSIVLFKTGLAQGNVGNATGVRRESGPEFDDVAALAIHTARAIGLVGPVDVDIRRLADGPPVVLEVNARFGANSAHAPELVEALIQTIADRQRRTALVTR